MNTSFVLVLVLLQTSMRKLSYMLVFIEHHRARQNDLKTVLILSFLLIILKVKIFSKYK